MKPSPLPTSIKLEFFSAQRGKDKTGADRVVLLWKTGAEAHNLGFNVYREQGGERIPFEFFADRRDRPC